MGGEHHSGEPSGLSRENVTLGLLLINRYRVVRCIIISSNILVDMYSQMYSLWLGFYPMGVNNHPVTRYNLPKTIPVKITGFLWLETKYVSLQPYQY